MVQDTSEVLSAGCDFRSKSDGWQESCFYMRVLHATLSGVSSYDFAQGRSTPPEIESYEMSLANAKAAAAATPPITIVCSALRAGPVPV